MYRTIENRVLGDIRSVAIKKPAIDYVNAWYPSLVIGEGGRIYGAWNQHYPALLGVCAGNLVDEGSSVTRLQGSIEDNENGGYPSIVVDGGGRTWVFWESFGWDVLAGKPQRILASCDEEGEGRWSLPYEVSRDEQTFLNQTPRAAVDRDGVIHVVWSGRDAAGERPWEIYLSSFAGGQWSAPRRLSEEGENARAPAIAVGAQGELWVAWHSGVGDGMRTRVLRVGGSGAVEPAEAIASDQGV
jgi:hypothetical protein